MKRLEFSDKQKALIYERDKGICAFSGKILWIFHYGVSCLWDTDWVDHIKPATKGGNNSIENGICASSFFNSKKRDNSNDNKFLFKNGSPTEYFYIAQGFYSNELITHLKQFKNINFSDWYFNRAIQNLMISLEHKNNSYDLKGNPLKRDFNYWINASFKRINEWKKITSENSIVNFKERLYDKNDIFGSDQEILLEIFNINGINDIKSIANELFPYYENSVNFFKKLNTIKNLDINIDEFKIEIENQKKLSNRDKEILLNALKLETL